MPVFSEEDNKTVKTAGMGAAGLTVVQIIVEVYINGQVIPVLLHPLQPAVTCK